MTATTVLAADEQHWLWLLHDDAIPAPDALHGCCPRGLRPADRHHRPEAAAAQASARRPADQRGRGQHLRHRPARARPGHRRDRPGPTGPATRTTRRLDLRDAGPDRGLERPGRPRPGAPGVPRRGRVRLASPPQRLPGGHHATRARHPPSGRSSRSATARADRPATRQDRPAAGDGRGRRSCARAMLPLVWLRLVSSCLGHAAAYLVGKVPGRALDEILALGRLRRPPRPDHATSGPGPRRSTRPPAPARSCSAAPAVVEQPAGRRGGRRRRPWPTATARSPETSTPPPWTS